MSIYIYITSVVSNVFVIEILVCLGECTCTSPNESAYWLKALAHAKTIQQDIFHAIVEQLMGAIGFCYDPRMWSGLFNFLILSLIIKAICRSLGRSWHFDDPETVVLAWGLWVYDDWWSFQNNIFDPFFGVSNERNSIDNLHLLNPRMLW